MVLYYVHLFLGSRHDAISTLNITVPASMTPEGAALTEPSLLGSAKIS